MNQKLLIGFLSVFLVSFLFLNFIFQSNPQTSASPDIFIGVDVAYADLSAIKNLIEKISSYTNLFVIGSTGISHDETKLSETCQYLYERNINFIVYTDNPRRLSIINEIGKKYPDHFLGVYFDDEQGGRQLDQFEWRWVNEATSYSDASNQFVQGLKWWLNRRYPLNETTTPAPSDYHLFTSDYTLYWFDYKSGYDTDFAEFGCHHKDG